MSTPCVVIPLGVTAIRLVMGARYVAGCVVHTSSPGALSAVTVTVYSFVEPSSAVTVRVAGLVSFGTPEAGEPSR